MAILSLGSLTANIYVTHVRSHEIISEASQHCLFVLLIHALTSCVLIIATCRVQQGEGFLPTSQGGPGLGAAAVYPVLILSVLLCVGVILHPNLLAALCHMLVNSSIKELQETSTLMLHFIFGKQIVFSVFC